MRPIQNLQPKNQFSIPTPPEVFVTTNPVTTNPATTNPESPNADLPVAGWYADPADVSQIRFWDGQTWTKHAAAPASEITVPEPLIAPVESPQQTTAKSFAVDINLGKKDFETLGERTPRDATIAMFFGAFFVIVLAVSAVALITSR